MLPPSHSLADNVPKPGYMALTGWVNVAGTWVFPNSSPCQWAHMYLILLRPSLISMNSWEDRYNYFLVVTSLAERHHLLISSCCFFVLGAPWDRCSPLPPPCRVHVSAVTGRCRTWNGNEICGNEQLTHHLNLPSNSEEDCCLRWSPGSQQPGWSSQSAAAEAGWWWSSLQVYWITAAPSGQGVCLVFVTGARGVAALWYLHAVVSSKGFIIVIYF